LSAVRAFQPRKIDPPRFVAESYDDLADLVGGFIGAEQCDGCGNSTYIIRARTTTPDGPATYVAVCAVDPSDDPEFRHADPCGASYPIGTWDEDLVTF
jgi:hypothetical protein